MPLMDCTAMHKNKCYTLYGYIGRKEKKKQKQTGHLCSCSSLSREKDSFYGQASSNDSIILQF